MKGAKNLRTSKCNERKKELEKLALFVEECLEFDTPHHQNRYFCFNYGYSLGSYVTLLYLFMKSLFVINIFSQFVILNNFLGTNHSLWGFQVIFSRPLDYSFASFFLFLFQYSTVNLSVICKSYSAVRLEL